MRTTHRLLVIVVLVAVAVAVLASNPVSALQPPPQTREEFVAAVTDGARGAKKETITVDRPFDEVYATLEARHVRCLDVKVERTANVGYVEHSSSDYNPTLKKLGANAAEFAVQVVHNPRAIGEKTGPGGLYIFAADLKAVGASQTEVTLYRPTIGFKEITKTFMSWAESGADECPKLKY